MGCGHGSKWIWLLPQGVVDCEAWHSLLFFGLMVKMYYFMIFKVLSPLCEVATFSAENEGIAADLSH